MVKGQYVDPVKVERARQFRREMTNAEHSLWQGLKGNRLGGLHFRRQQLIAGFIVDFYCHARALVVEVDGEIHAQQRDQDQERDRILFARGLRVWRVTNEEVRTDLAGVLARIAEAAGEPIPPAPLPHGGRGDVVPSVRSARRGGRVEHNR